MFLTVYTVRGSGAFPSDMLRYDSSYPRSSDDVANLDGREIREVTLNCCGHNKQAAQPTPARWESFGWKIIRQEPTRKLH